MVKENLPFLHFFINFFLKDAYNDIYLEEEKDNVKVIFNVVDCEHEDNDHH